MSGSTEDEGLLRKLGLLAGIAPNYRDNWGRTVETSTETLLALLSAMGLGDHERSLQQLEGRPWNRLMEPSVVAPASNPPNHIPLYFHLPQGAAFEGELVIYDEAGALVHTAALGALLLADERVIDDARHVRIDAPLPEGLSVGYYTVEASVIAMGQRQSGRCMLALCPDQCHMPDKRLWGIVVNLYALTSHTGWGIGDFGDLRNIVAMASNLGAGFIGLNPLHAIPNKRPYLISPYFPTSRLYKNFIYIDAQALLHETRGGKAFIKREGILREAARLRALPEVDYDAVAALKKHALRFAYERFCLAHVNKSTALAREFMDYIDKEGRELEDYATFCVLQGKYGDEFDAWPLEFQDPRSEATELFRREHADHVRFEQYVQWIIERQLQQAREAAPMTLGLYFDLAVGSSGEGSDAWAHGEAFARGARSGAPPDALGPQGQKWPFPPFSPHALKDTGYGAFIKTLRKNLSGCGALRIDHALGLFRTFWIPKEMPASMGAYVQYPHEELLSLIALESVRAKAVIVAEDLGTIGENVRESLGRMGMLSYRILYFERNWHDGNFLAPEHYPHQALAAINTHDLATLAGYWQGRDIEVREALGYFAAPDSAQRERENRRADVMRLLESLRAQMQEHGASIPEQLGELTPELCVLVHRYLARTPSLMVAVTLEDLALEREQLNLPGTVDEYPNWKRKHSTCYEDALTGPLAKTLGVMFKEEGRGVT